jgi:rRNA maturation RNase YbeY
VTFRLHCSPALPEPPAPGCLQRLEEAGRLTLATHPVGGAVDAILTDDAEVRRLNHEFRDRDTATDVLSFSLLDGAQPARPDADMGEDELPAGEIYISVERAAEQALDLDVPVDEEMTRLLIHGLLHLAGYDHPDETSLAAMERLTDELLDRCDTLRSGERPH